MVSWVKSSLILVIAMAFVLIAANAQDWPVVLLLTGSIIGVFAALFGHTDNNRPFRGRSAFHFFFLSAAVLLVVFLIYQAASYGIRAMIAGVLTGEGAMATESELIIFWSLATEILLCVLMIRYIPGRIAPDHSKLRARHVGSR